jgi:hypothetical protein
MVQKKNAIFWDVTPCGSCKIQSFDGTYGLHHQCDKNRCARNVSMLILVTLMMKSTYYIGSYKSRTV